MIQVGWMGAAAELAQTKARGLKTERSLFKQLLSNAEPASVQRDTRRVQEQIREEAPRHDDRLCRHRQPALRRGTVDGSRVVEA